LWVNFIKTVVKKSLELMTQDKKVPVGRNRVGNERIETSWGIYGDRKNLQNRAV